MGAYHRIGENEMNVTSIGPVTKETRDELRGIRDEKNLSNYNETLSYLLELANTGK